MIFDYFRSTGALDAVLDYADLFSVTLRCDYDQEFDKRWDEILLSMTTNVFSLLPDLIAGRGGA